MIGALATPGTMETLGRQVEDAVAKGGRLLLGGERPTGPAWAWPATVVGDATHEMELMTEESFGPVIGLMPVDDDAEGIRRMNQAHYGLTASIWTASIWVNISRSIRIWEKSSGSRC